jgi:catecholate siderophore receptor
MGLGSAQRLVVAGALVGSLAPGLAMAAAPGGDTTPDGNAPPSDNDRSGEIKVTGIRSLTSDKIPDGVLDAAQSIDIVSRRTLEDQATTRLQDALKNVPGITLNAGEGSARGDTVNLRGFQAFNDFFLDGIRDAAIYSRDSFNLESIEVLKGPSAILFGRGSTGGAINQVSKAPTLAPLHAATLIGGTNDLIRGTADIDVPIGGSAAIRINAMGERSQVVDRDEVFHHRWGIAPSIAIGIGGRDALTLSYLHQEENGRQDTGIPFVDGKPAPVKRSNFYGLDSDRATADADIATLRYRHELTSDIAISNTLRYARYTFGNFVDSAHFGYFGSPGAPTAATPIASILVGRDAPSSDGIRTDLIDQTDVTAHFSTGPIAHTLVFGTEFGRERDTTFRYTNPLGTPGETPPTSLLDPDPAAPAAFQQRRIRAFTQAFSEAAYATETAHIGLFDITGGVRFDRFAAHFRPTALIPGVPASSLVPLDHVDEIWSPRAAIMFRPSAHARIYVSYGTSFDPSAEALSLNAKTANLGPVKAKSYELGAKLDWMGGRLVTNAAIFRTQIDNAQTTDVDHPTRLILGGNQRVEGIELGMTGRLTDKWEIVAGYTRLDGRTVASTTPGIVGKQLANVAHNAVNLWTEYELTDKLELGIGGNYLSRRFADLANTAIVPSYILVDAMIAYSVNPHLRLSVNANNLFDTLAYQSVYYANSLENHVIPVPGRTILFSAAVRY